MLPRWSSSLLLSRDCMPITANPGMLVLAAALTATRIFAHQHVMMLPDAMPLMLRHVNPALAFSWWRRLRGRPREVISPDLDVIVGKLAKLIVVHTQQFGFLGSAEVQARDQVDEGCDDEGHGEGPAGSGADVGKLPVELAIVVVDPAADDDACVDAIKADDVGRSKEGIGHQAQHAGDGVFGEDVERVIDIQQVLNC